MTVVQAFLVVIGGALLVNLAFWLLFFLAHQVPIFQRAMKTGGGKLGAFFDAVSIFIIHNHRKIQNIAAVGIVVSIAMSIFMAGMFFAAPGSVTPWIPTKFRNWRVLAELAILWLILVVMTFYYIFRGSKFYVIQ